MIKKIDSNSNEVVKEITSYVKCEDSEILSISSDSRNNIMYYCHEYYTSSLEDRENINTFMHNKIMIDYEFIKYARKLGVEITRLCKGPVVSWKLENDEKFVFQGIFKIKGKDFEFLHCSTFRKGLHHEDEITFFTLVSNKNYAKYDSFVKGFESYSKHNDPNQLLIKIVDAEEIPYKKDHSWDDLVLNANIKTNLQKTITTFLSSKELYLNNNVPWKQALLLHGPSGTGKSTALKTIMSEFELFPITVTLGATDEIVMDAFTLASASGPTLLYFEHLDILLQNGVDGSVFNSFLDSLNAKNGVLIIATANNIKNIDPSLMDRASRFNKKFEFSLPTQENAHIYLKKWFGNMVSAKKLKDLAKNAEKSQLSYAFLKQLFINSMLEAFSNNRKSPSDKDIDSTFGKLVKDRNLLNKRSISTDQYIE